MTGASVDAYLGLGSNLGDRRAALLEAVERLRRHPDVLEVELSTIHETEPVGSVDAPAQGGPYLNAVARVRTRLAPVALLRLCLEVERGLGRVRTVRNAPRLIDLDLVLYGDEIIDRSGLEAGVDLVVPHPRMLERSFVLEPLAELCPERLHPITGRSVRDHRDALRASRHDPG